LSGPPIAISSITRAAEGSPQGLLVLIHGRGADEHDLLPLADVLDPERRLVAVLPRGPLHLPPGGAHWYVVHEIGRPDPGTFLPTYAALGEWLDATAAAHGIMFDRVVVAGFSQGAVMSYALGLGAGRPRPAGIIALSGFIPAVAGFDLDLAGRAGLPVAVGHGMLDPVIGVEFGRRARALLEESGLAVRYQESPMAHSIDPAFLRELHGWLGQVVPDR
jgi:phospholipase/carboxylesterase